MSLLSFYLTWIDLKYIKLFLKRVAGNYRYDFIIDKNLKFPEISQMTEKNIVILLLKIMKLQLCKYYDEAFKISFEVVNELLTLSITNTL